MIAPHELFAAFGTLETFLARMRASMSLQLIGPRETLPAEQPGADKWAFTCVPSEMSPKMGGFAVHFVAARDMTDVLFFTVRMPGGRTCVSVQCIQTFYVNHFTLLLITLFIIMFILIHVVGDGHISYLS